MCIVKALARRPGKALVRIGCFTTLSLLFALTGWQPAFAHPVSQGAIEIVLADDALELRATVSLEQVIVATALSGDEDTATEIALQKHGDYLLAHVHLLADGRPVPGRLLEVPTLSTGRLIYRLSYPLDKASSQRIELRQDVLREFLFGPGNPWEASYIVKIIKNGRPAGESALFTHREPLLLQSGAVADRPGIGAAFVRHGILHILTGYDHLLFVGALVLAVTGCRELFLVIAMFTLAHTLTLTLAALDIVRLPAHIVEPMISASIVIVSLQNVLWPKSSHGRTRLLIAFGFGLFHGLGFAGGLLNVMSGMAFAGIALAIAAFSLGVEIGHMAVVLPAFWTLGLLRKMDRGGPRLGRWAQSGGSAVIFCFGMAYLYTSLQAVP